MPCKKCKDNKYKYGNTGECKYATKEECEKENPKKYNKMKKYPSPIGKKTYEEYAKELKEYNLSLQPKLQKVELGIAQDLEKAVKKSEDFVKKSDKIIQKIDKARKTYNDLWEKTRTQTDEVKKQITFNNNRIKEANDVAKELGVNPKDIKPLKKIAESNKDLNRLINFLKYPAIK